MTSEPRRFPIGLTLAAAGGVAVCASLGVWQLQRAAWKTHVLAEIAARREAPAQPIGPVLARAARGEDAAFTRVVADCQPSTAATSYQAGSDSNGWVWRALAPCPLVGAPYPAIMVDRGILEASRGSTVQPTLALSPPRQVTGLLKPAPKPGAGSLPYVLAAERETPAPEGVTPTDLAGVVPENLQYVGAYAPTWFGLAGVLAGVYAALLWRRLRTP